MHYFCVELCVDTLPPNGLSVVLPLCWICGLAGLPFTSRRLILHCGGPLLAGLSGFVPFASGLALSGRSGLPGPPPAPPHCSMPV